MPHNPKIRNQSGVTGLGWLVILSVIGFFIFLGLKAVPLYIDHYRVSAVLESLREEPKGTYRSKKDVTKLMMKRLKINYVWNFDPKSIKVTNSKGGYDVHVKFEARENLFGPMDLAMRFDDKVSVVK